jgi:hypothetical protein
MTAEITMLNKSAIVLAADSAVTFSNDQGQRVFHSANKLFMLSKYHPVGIMIYQNADLMNMPWESIIKIFRKSLGKQEFPNLIDYANKFIEFFSTEKKLFSEELQKQHFKDLSLICLNMLRDQIRQAFERESKSKVQKQEPPLTPEELNKLFENLINEEWQKSQDAVVLPCFKDFKVSDLLVKYEAILDELIKKVFEAAPLSGDARRKLKEYIINYFIKDSFFTYTGVVIAGFGKDEIFPSYVNFQAEFVFENKLKHSALLHKKPQDAVLEFFAQSEKGMGFVTGIDAGLQVHAAKKLNEFKANLEDEATKKLTEMFGKEKEGDIKKLLNGLLNMGATEYTTAIQTYIRERSINQITQTISMLPKEELAAVAETLVNLTSFKKRVSGEPETVGGPIDVAVISKGDGFIWIKRKHYFDPRLNQHFLENYYLGDSDE